jgi:FkbM family methyltransferase
LTTVGTLPFVSYAQNREDVVLTRALRDVQNGRYVDVGANDPIHESVSYAFYERGWSGITVEPVPEFAHRLREVRPRDVVIQAAITNDDSETVTLHQIASTGLSTLVDDVGDGHRGAGWEIEDVEVEARRLDQVLEHAGWGGLEIHFMVIDTEGAERSVLETLDLTRWRPWILVVEATRPLTTEPSHDGWEHIILGGGYEFCLFDGLSRFYVAAEKAEELRSALIAPANPLDEYTLHSTRVAERERDEAIAEMRRHDEGLQAALLRWRAAALRAWATSAEMRQEQDLRKQIEEHVNHVQHVDEQLAAMRRTLSWRVTRPLRMLKSVARRGGAGV